MSKSRSLADLLSGGVPSFAGTGAIDVPSGTTAQRPANPNTGYVRFNTTLDQLEQYTSDSGWQGISAPPTITTTDVTNVDETDTSQVIVITGQNFDATAVAKLIDANGVEKNPTTSVRDSSSQITITFSDGDVLTSSVSEPLDVKVINGSGLSFVLEDQITIDATPVWSTTSGSLATVIEDTAMSSVQLSASDPEGQSIAYTVSSGALPAGVSLSSGGLISGTPNVNDSYNASGITHNFSVAASDGTGNSTVRAFSILRKWSDGTTVSQYAESANAIYQINSSATNGYYYIRNYGSSTPKRMYCDFTTAGGPWTIPFVNTTTGAFSDNGPTALAFYLNLIRGVGIGTPGRGMESSRTTTEVYGAWQAVKNFIHSQFPGFYGSSSSAGVLLMPMLNINGEGGSSDHRLVYNTSLGTHIPPNVDGDACDAGQLFCGHWGANDRASWTTNNGAVPGAEDWGPENPTSSNDYATGGGGDFTVLDPLVAFGIYR